MHYFKIRKSSFVLLLVFLCSAIIALIFMFCKSERKATFYERSINAGYTRALAELSEDISEIDMSLQKSLYSTSPAVLSALCSNISSKATAAQSAMAELPFSNYILENASSFITRTGDYALALSRKVSCGLPLSADEYSILQNLSNAAGILSQNLFEIQGEIESGSMSISELRQSNISVANASALLGDRFQAIENEFPEIPTLIYDGPFSQHIDTASSKLLNGMAAITQEEALKQAAVFSDMAEEELRFSHKTETEIPLYHFSDANGQVIISVTEQGGMVFSMSKYNADSGTAIIENSQAVSIAADFLASHGFDKMQESYWEQYDNTLLINFAAVDNGYICYPDLAKVEVSLNSGKITGFEAAGYITNHSPRNFPSEIISETSASEKVPSSLEILSHNLCIIPSSGKNELFCHEFKCENEQGNHYLLYINAETGEQEKILCLIENSNGTLTM